MFSILNVHGVEGVQSHHVLTRDWTFTPSRPWHGTFAHRLKASLAGRRPPPDSIIIKPPSFRPRWIMYFAYMPDGVATPSHKYTLDKLKYTDAGIFVVCALPNGSEVPKIVHEYADAVASKSLSGFDFSAYAIGLRCIAATSPGCDLFIMNDSVFGPFRNVDEDIADAKWDLTGYTAYSLIENHIQSYAFIIKNVTDKVEVALRPVMPYGYTYDRYKDVVFQQETRLAKVASRHMSVGAKWYSNHRVTSEPSFFSALSLLETGFPFLKKSLLHRRPDIYDRNNILEVLEGLGHPRP